MNDNKINKKETIIFTAAQMIHDKGFNNVGIKSILDELNIPKGSFYHYFKSKDELCFSIIDLYVEDTRNCLLQVEKSVDGLLEFFNIYFNRLIEMKMRKGCPVGNLILELSDESESFRLRLLQWYQIVETWIIDVLIAEKIAEPEKKAKALIAAFEGTMLVSKLDKDCIHFNLFNEVIFTSILEIKG